MKPSSALFILALFAAPLSAQSAADDISGRAVDPVIARALQIEPGDYPKEPVDWSALGRVAVKLTIDPKGRVAACDILETSGSAAIDRASCQLIEKRGRFQPARDSDGKAVTGTWSTGIVWRAPGAQPLPAATRLVISYVVDETGRRSDCQVEALEGLSFEGRDPCLRVPELFDPHRDADGKPVRTRVRQTQEVELIVLSD